MNGRVDPSSTLREKDTEGIGHDCLAVRLRTEHHLALRESLEHESRQVTILPEQQEILLM